MYPLTACHCLPLCREGYRLWRSFCPRCGGGSGSRSLSPEPTPAETVYTRVSGLLSGARHRQQSISTREGSGAMTEWANVVVQGVLIGGLYAMFAAGLSLIFGIMRLVNIANGDFIVLAAYMALVASTTLGLNPILALVIVAPLMAALGYVLQRLLLNSTLGDDLLPPLLVTFGLSVIIQNGLLELFTADSRRLQAGAIEVASIPVSPGISIGVLPLLQFALALAVICAMQFVFYRTALGRAFRATSDDQAMAQLMGLDNRHVFAL